ncbi:MAG TPA: EAL domain-containing protein [Rhodanobacteraceae bacterium]|nr:EAL domain-containing protein [Rhodanobacteraceae bacterium]
MNLILLAVAIGAALTSIVLAAWSLRRQRRVARELQVSRERYMLAMEGANDGIWDFDLTTRQIYFSPRVHQMLGYTAAELSSPADLQRIMLPEDYSEARAALYGHVERGRHDELRRTMRLRTKDGRVLTILARSVALYAGDGTPVRVAGSYTDITARLGDERQLQLAASVFEAASDAIVIGDEHDRVVSVNRVFLELTGHAREALIGRALADLMVQNEASVRLAAALRDTGRWHGDLAWRKAGSGTKTVESTVVTVRDAEGAVLFHVFACADVAELKYAQARIRHLAYFDVLTGLPNRTHLRGQFEDALAKARHGGQPLSVVFFDLDNFKEINDTAGHSVGDEVIRAVAQRLGEGVREDDVLCRFGGDEFLLLLPNTDAAAAEALAQRLVQAICQPIEIEGRSLDVAASAGYSVFPDDALDAENLLRESDTALFRAKGEGGNSVRRFQAWMGEAVSWRHDLTTALRVAIVRSQFTLRYQPVMDTIAGHLLGVEALLYWNRPGLGVVGPGTFIEVAEASRLIEPIGAWVLEEACRQMAAWKALGLPAFYVAVNVSGLQLRDARRFEEHLDTVMRKHGIELTDLVLEITERHLLQEVEGALPAVQGLIARGLRVSVDDFGTGYSNLESLKRLAVSQIKIDRAFVRNLTTEVGDRAIVQSIVALGRSLGLQVVAEGVETIEQRRLLHEFNCDVVQGYLYSRPLPPAKLPAFIAGLRAP